MKFKYFAFVLSILMFGKSYSQIAKGTNLIEAGFQYSLETKDDNLKTIYNYTSKSNFLFAIGFNKFFKDGVCFGANIGLVTANQEEMDGSDRNFMDLSGVLLGLNARIYAPSIGKFNFYINPNFTNTMMSGNLDIYKNSVLDFRLRNKVLMNNIGFGAGVTYFITPNWAVEAYLSRLLSYNYTNTYIQDPSTFDYSSETKIDFSFLPVGLDKMSVGVSCFF